MAKLQQEGDLTTESTELVRLFKIWLQDAELELAHKQISTQWELAEEEVFADIDIVLMQRAFDNVLRNAIRFSPEGSTLTLSVNKKNQNVVFQLRDQGPGVDEAQLEEIFAPFTQADHSRNHANGGYGIGLAMVKRIINMHNGEVSAVNIPNAGLCIEWSIPERK